MVAANNFYWRSGDERTLRDDFQKIVSVLTAHQIALWKYDVQTGECTFSDEYFRILGLDKSGIRFEDVEDSYRFFYADDLKPYQEAFARMLGQ